MPTLGPTELIIIGFIIILLFGAKKLPDTARALGQSLRLFKKETAKDDAEEVTVVKTETVVPPAQIPPATPVVPTTPSVEDRLRLLEEENARLRVTKPAENQN